MSLRIFVGFCIWPAAFLLAFDVSVRLLPPRPLLTLPFAGASDATISPDNRVLMTEPPLRFWNLADGCEQSVRYMGEDVSQFTGHRYTRLIGGGHLLLDQRLAQVPSRWILRVLDVTTGREAFHVEHERSRPYIGVISGDGLRLANFWNRQVEVWDVMSGARMARIASGPAVLFSPDGNRLLTYTMSAVGTEKTEELAVWDVTGNRELRRISVPTGCILEPKFSSDGKTLALNCAGKRGLFELVDVGTGREKLRLPPVQSFAFALQDRVLAAAAWNENYLRCWNTATGEEIGGILLAQPGNSVRASVQASPDGRTLAVRVTSRVAPRSLPSRLPRWKWLTKIWERSVLAHSVRVFDAETKRDLGVPGGSPRCYGFSLDGSLLALLNADGGIDIWELPPRKPLWLAASLAASFVAVACAVRVGYQRFRRRGASAAFPEDRHVNQHHGSRLHDRRRQPPVDRVPR